MALSCVRSIAASSSATLLAPSVREPPPVPPALRISSARATASLASVASSSASSARHARGSSTCHK
eukprot:scaffold1116_cov103-Isochrysis_galbana.AAC.5